jgi:hypothetical protein
MGLSQEQYGQLILNIRVVCFKGDTRRLVVNSHCPATSAPNRA